MIFISTSLNLILKRAIKHRDGKLPNNLSAEIGKYNSFFKYELYFCSLFGVIFYSIKFNCVAGLAALAV